MYQGCVLQVAVPSPMRCALDYLPVAGGQVDAARIGCRVRVPLGRRLVVGVVVGLATASTLSQHQLKPADGWVDDRPLLSSSLLQLLTWLSEYYHAPLGEVVCGLLPRALREDASLELVSDSYYQITSAGRDALTTIKPQAHLQRAVLDTLLNQALSWAELRSKGIKRAPLHAACEKGWVQTVEPRHERVSSACSPAAFSMTDEQTHAIDQIVGSSGFKVWLLQGITGSGKTEVYIQVISALLQAGQQALYLVPEIGLTPQTQQRISQRFQVPVIVMHSQLSEKQRAQRWLQANQDQPCIVLGTRSAIFAALPRLGIIILDEEHDASFKQQAGVRYSARDVAVMRAHQLAIPVVLGSATPSLESLHNVTTGRYQALALTRRVGGGQSPQLQCLDIRDQPLEAGMSQTLLDAIDRQLARSEQVLLFLNRRGYAPALLCHHCGWVVPCQQCDAVLTLHQQQQRMRCHHCQSSWPLLRYCQRCQQAELMPVGVGTEQVMQAIQARFPTAVTVRIDRDTATSPRQLHQRLEQIHSGEADIIIGTQMVAKGHHFSGVTLVAVIDADGALYSTDFRAIEHMGQQILQVAGRSGRESPGEVIIQTHHPEHPLLQTLMQSGYEAFAAALSEERSLAGLPPHGYQAIVRAESRVAEHAQAFLQAVQQAGRSVDGDIAVFGPIPAAMTKRANRYRYQLVVQATQRSRLQQCLKYCMTAAEQHPLRGRCRWLVDVDPIETI